MGHGTPLPTHDHIHRVGQTLSFQMIPNTCTLLAFCRLWDPKDWRVNVWEAWILGFLVVIQVCTETKNTQVHHFSHRIVQISLKIDPHTCQYVFVTVLTDTLHEFGRIFVLRTCQNVVQSCIQVDTWSTLTKGGQFCWAFFQIFPPNGENDYIYSESIILACLHSYSVAIGLSM